MKDKLEFVLFISRIITVAVGIFLCVIGGKLLPLGLLFLLAWYNCCWWALYSRTEEHE